MHTIPCQAGAALAALLLCTNVTAQTRPEAAQARVERFAPGTAAFSESVARRLDVPRGFQVNVFASGLENPRMMEVAPDGTVYVTRREQQDVLTLRDNDGDGRADERQVFARLPGVHGIALHQGQLFLASSTTIWRTPLGSAAPQVVVSGLPDGGQHPNRTLRFAPDGAMLVSVGSSCNDCAEENQLERGTLIRYAADGSSRRVIANGLRNTIGFDWHPVTGQLWGMDHGSDFRGDHVPPEELNRIVDGGNHGWPICYGRRVVDPMTNARPERMALRPNQAQPSGEPMSREAYCGQTVPAELLLPAHAAPMDMRFIRGGPYPAQWRGDAFVSLRGSWNRGDPVGYKVVRISFGAQGEPTGVSVPPSHLEVRGRARKDRVHVGIDGRDDKREQEDTSSVRRAVQGDGAGAVRGAWRVGGPGGHVARHQRQRGAPMAAIGPRG